MHRELTVACGNYDRVWPLVDQTVRAEGLDLRIIRLEPEECFWRMLNYSEFDAAEMSLGSYWQTRARGDDRFIGIPVFLSRAFRHSTVYLRPGSPIHDAKDLEGCRIGVPEYQMTAAVWMRGILQHEFDVDLDTITWVTGGLEQPGRQERQPLQLSRPIQIEKLTVGHTLGQDLADGGIDALISPRVPSVFHQAGTEITRLFPNYAEREIDYYRRTQIFPIMHLLVIRSDVYYRDPWIAESLNKAFTQAKNVAISGVMDAPALRFMLPMLLNTLERQRDIFGPDPWPYGFAASKHELDMFGQYLAEQALVSNQLDPSSLFAASTVAEPRI